MTTRFSLVRVEQVLRRLHRGTAGNTFVEYAIFLGILIGAIAVVGSALGLSMRTSFERVVANSTGPNNTHQRAPLDANAVRSFTPWSDQTTREHTQARQLVAIALLLCVGLVVWFMLYCHNRPKAISAQESHALHQLEREVNQDVIFAKRQDILHKLSQNLPGLVSGQIHIAELMSRHLVTVSPGTPAADVRALMQEKRVRHLLVCAPSGELQGIISIKDVQKANAATAAAMMTKDVLTVEPHALLDPTITLLLHNRISCLPVVKDKHLFGIFTTTDALMTLQCVSLLMQKMAHEPQSHHS